MTPMQESYEKTAKTVIANLKKRQMEGYYCTDKAAAVQKVLELMPKGASVSWGGSMTLSEAGIMDALSASEYCLIDRATAKTPEEQRAVYSAICGSDFFLTSTNAITLDGELVNIDGNGSRLAFLIFGPQNVIVVAGMNKLVKDVESGYQRVKTVACPPNATRLSRKTPCAVNGVCGDCYASDCICSQTVITRRSHIPNRIKVILVGESLGY